MKKNQNESGNVIFFILIAVTLLAALSYAVTQSGRNGSKGITAERAQMAATEILDTANALAAGVSQIRLRGVPVTSLCFDHDSWGASNYNYAACTDNLNKIFHPSGAGIIWQNAPSEAMDSAATPDNLWHIYGDNEIKDIGLTLGTAESSDLVLMVDELDVTVCQKINELLGVTAAGATPPVDTLYGETRYIGAFGYTATIGDEDAALAGKTAACFQKTTVPAEYAFYKVLVAR